MEDAKDPLAQLTPASYLATLFLLPFYLLQPSRHIRKAGTWWSTNPLAELIQNEKMITWGKS